MKSLRYIKLRTLCRDPIDLVLDRNQSPLLQRVPVQKTHAWTSELLQSYRTPCVIEEELSKPSVSFMLVAASLTSEIYQSPLRMES